MKVGLDPYTISCLKLRPREQLDFAAEMNLAGVQFGGLKSLSKELRVEELCELRAHAKSRGLYMHVSVGSPNPHSGKTSVPLDALAADLTREIQVAAECGWRELHSCLGSDSNRYNGAVTWKRQLADSQIVMDQLRPVLRDCGSRLNLEDHGDTTTFELVRFCEQAGPEICGIFFDTGNVLCFAEDPLSAVKRAAPFTHMTHLKDGILFLSEKGLTRQVRPAGKGVMPWEEALPILAKHCPDLTLSIEDHKMLFEVPIFTEDWMRQQADLTREELAKTVAVAWGCQRKIASGEMEDPAQYEAVPYIEQMKTRLASARDHLNGIITRQGLAGG